MAKKSEKENLQNVIFRMTPSEVERLDDLAEKADLTRSQFIRNLIVIGMDETETFNKLGLFRAAITVRDICSWMSHKVSDEIAKD